MVFNAAVLVLRFANPEMPINVFMCKTQLLDTECVRGGTVMVNISGKKLRWRLFCVTSSDVKSGVCVCFHVWKPARANIPAHSLKWIWYKMKFLKFDVFTSFSSNIYRKSCLLPQRLWPLTSQTAPPLSGSGKRPYGAKHLAVAPTLLTTSRAEPISWSELRRRRMASSCSSCFDLWGD